MGSSNSSSTLGTTLPGQHEGGGKQGTSHFFVAARRRPELLLQAPPASSEPNDPQPSPSRLSGATAPRGALQRRCWSAVQQPPLAGLPSPLHPAPRGGSHAAAAAHAHPAQRRPLRLAVCRAPSNFPTAAQPRVWLCRLPTGPKPGQSHELAGGGAVGFGLGLVANQRARSQSQAAGREGVSKTALRPTPIG